MKVCLYLLICLISIRAFAENPFILTNTPEMMKKEGVNAQMLPWEDGLRQSTVPGNYEWWYFDAHLNDGSKFVAVFFTKPNALAEGPLMPKVSITLTHPDGTVITDKMSYKASEFSASKSQCNVMIGPNKVVGDLKTYYLHLTGSKIKADLKFTRTVPSWRHGAGKVYFDQNLTKYMGWVIPIPCGNVTGKIEYHGVTKQVSGSGYHDHNWGNYAFYNVFDYWLWGRAHVGKYTFVFFDGVGLKKWNNKHLPLFMMAEDNKILIDNPSIYKITNGTLVYDQVPYGRKYPKEFQIFAKQNNIEANLKFANSEIIDRDDVLGAIPLTWLSSLIRPYFNPWYLRFDSNMSGSIKQQDTVEPIKGKSIYEMMLLGQASTL